MTIKAEANKALTTFITCLRIVAAAAIAGLAVYCLALGVWQIIKIIGLSLWLGFIALFYFAAFAAFLVVLAFLLPNSVMGRWPRRRSMDRPKWLDPAPAQEIVTDEPEPGFRIVRGGVQEV